MAENSILCISNACAVCGCSRQSSRSPSAHTLLLLKYTYVHLHNGGALCACSSLLYGALQSQWSFDTIDVTTYVRINMIGTIRFCFMRSYQSRSNFCIKYIISFSITISPLVLRQRGDCTFVHAALECTPSCWGALCALFVS